MKRFFRYIEPMWLGHDKQISIRRVLALVFSIDLVSNLHYAVFNWKVGSSYSDAALLLGIEAGLIAALLSLTTYSSAVAPKSSVTVDNNLGS
jgi:hypothetical protein